MDECDETFKETVGDGEEEGKRKGKGLGRGRIVDQVVGRGF